MKPTRNSFEEQLKVVILNAFNKKQTLNKPLSYCVFVRTDSEFANSLRTSCAVKLINHLRWISENIDYQNDAKHIIRSI